MKQIWKNRCKGFLFGFGLVMGLVGGAVGMTCWMLWLKENPILALSGLYFGIAFVVGLVMAKIYE